MTSYYRLNEDKSISPTDPVCRIVDRTHRWVVIGAGVLFAMQAIQMLWPDSAITRAIIAFWP